MARERWTVLRVLRWTRDYLGDKHIANPRLEGELLLSHVLGLDRVGLYVHYDMALSTDELERFKEVLQRRTAGEPLQYITGYQEFWSIRFKVGPHVLIPRPETEILVEEALRLAGEEPWRHSRIMEMGTGCGAIAVALAKSITSAEIMATDVSQEALTLARENARIHGVASTIRFVQGDILSFINPGFRGFDMIISNPPYIKRENMEKLQTEIRDFEPRGALDGGADGHDFHRELLDQGRWCLSTGGWLLLEMGDDQASTIVQLIDQDGTYRGVKILQDDSGRSRALVVQRS